MSTRDSLDIRSLTCVVTVATTPADLRTMLLIPSVLLTVAS
jgi:hypothetical protein